MLKEKDYLERLRQLIVMVDSCLEKGDLDTLNNELNKHVLFILKKEREEVEPTPPYSDEVDLGFEGFMEKKLRPKFGYDHTPPEPERTNDRFFKYEIIHEFLKKRKDADASTKSGDTEVR